MKVSIIGNTSRNIGVACAGDFSLAGHEVRFAVFADQSAHIAQAIASGELALEGDSKNSISGRTGRSTLRSIGADPVAAVDGAEIVILDIAMQEIVGRFGDLATGLAPGALVHVQSYGCWASCLLTPLLRHAGRKDVLVTEAAAPSTFAKFSGETVTPMTLRRGLALASMPGSMIGPAVKKLAPLFPGLIAADSVLQTGLGNINLMVHPAIVLLGVGMCERAELLGQKISFYREANVPSAGRLADLLDRERANVCEAYGVGYQSLPKTLEVTYGAEGRNAYDAIRTCGPYQNNVNTSPDLWRGWLRDDVPFAVAPLVRLGEQAGLRLPLHRAVAEIFGAILEFDPWAGPDLATLGLEGRPAEVMARVRS